MNNKKQKILLLENDLHLSNFLSKSLIENGYTVEENHILENNIVSVLSFQPDLIVLNLHIFSGNEYEFFKYIKGSKTKKNIPFLFLNSFSEIENILTEYNLMLVDFVSNPNEIKEILGRTKKLFKISQTFINQLEKINSLEDDVIEQKLEKLVVQEKEERLATILDSVEAFIYIKDREYQYQYANKKLRDLFGKSLEDIVDKDDFEFFDISTATKLRENDTQVIGLGKRFAEEEINTGRDGLITTAFLSVKLPMYTENGFVYALCGISTEITERKIAEDELRRTLNLLEKQHSQLKITQAQLVQSEKMASLGTLVAGVAHEVNNPTNYINISANSLHTDLGNFRKDFSEIIADSDLETVQFFENKFNKFERSLNNIMEGSERIRMIVLDLRTFSRLDEAEKKEVNLIEILESTLRIVKTQIQNSVEIITEYTFNKNFECYPAQLGQVFLNILLNSYQAIIQRKESENISGKIVINLYSDSKAVMVSISDNGTGMSQEVKKKMFEPFFTTKPVGKGTGLGMSISYGIIKKHNGNIEVESNINLGTIIKVILPFNG